MKKLQKLMALMMALMMLLGVVPAMAEGAQSPAAENLGEPGAIAYLMFADGAWVNQVWNPGERPAGMTITEAPMQWRRGARVVGWQWHCERKEDSDG